MKIKLLSSAYDSQTVDIRIKTNVLQAIFIVMTISLFGGMIKNLFFGNFFMIAFEAVFIIFSIAVIILQYKGWYRLGWSFAISTGLLISFALMLSRSPSVMDATYMMFCLSISVLLLSNFSVGRLTFWITTPVIYGSIIVMMAARIVPYAIKINALPDVLDTFYSTLIFFILAHVLGVVSWGSNQVLVKNLQKSEDEVKMKMKTLTGWLHSLSESMDIGAKLNTAAETISQNLHEIGEKTRSSRENQKIVEESVRQISGLQAQIIEANESVKNKINNQSVAFEQTTAAIAQMASSIESMSASANEKIEKLTAVSATVQEGIDRLVSSVQIFDGIIASINQMSEIVSVIEDISERTNLLAMNASIESVHAGDAGKGFSIVAQSIRDLSEETSKNSKIISAMIKKNIQDVKNAVVANTGSSDNMKMIAQEIVNVSSSLSEINNGLMELSQGTGEINKAVYHVVDLKKEVDVSTERMSSIIDEENRAVDDVKKAIDVIGNEIGSIDSGLVSVRSESDHLVEIGKTNENALAALQEKAVEY